MSMTGHSAAQTATESSSGVVSPVGTALLSTKRQRGGQYNDERMLSNRGQKSKERFLAKDATGFSTQGSKDSEARGPQQSFL